MTAKLPLILLAICVLIAGTVYLITHQYPGFDATALHVANILMFLLSLAASAMMRNKVGERPQAFLRGVYSATMLRLFVCMAGILGYALLFRETLHKPTLFVMFGIYLVYTALETVAMSRSAKKL